MGTMEEIEARFMGINFDFKSQKHQTTSSKKRTDSTCRSSPPETRDWRDTHVTPVKDQDGCQSCWAFSAVGAIEAAYAKAGNGLIPFSESDLVDCMDDWGCDNGGLPLKAFDYVFRNGIATAEQVPYETTENDCKEDITRDVKIDRYDRVDPKTEDELEIIVGCEGPVSALVCVDYNFIDYDGKDGDGIYDLDSDIDCKHCEPNHAVLVVGYTADYWIIKNSWGASDWGDKGYMKMKKRQSEL